MTTNNPGDIGIMITYLLVVSSSASSILFASSNLAKSASSIERLHEYAFWTDHEKPLEEPKPKVENWPKSGKIIARNLSVRYRPNLPLVLDGVDFTIESGEKVGIVGRTGSGKSTILLALMRILEISEKDEKPVGSVDIDDQQIDQVGIHYLRKGLAIIPQDPFLLEGTLQFNIDPENKFKESEILEVLKKVGIAETIKAADLIDLRVEELKKKKQIAMMLAGKKPAGKPPAGKPIAEQKPSLPKEGDQVDNKNDNESKSFKLN